MKEQGPNPSKGYFWWATVVFITTALVYATFIPEFLLGYPLDPVKSFLSEYAALDSPYRGLFAGADVLYAVGSLLGVGLIAKTGWLNKSQGAMILASAFVGAAGFTVLDVLFPMTCAESLASCPPGGVDAHLIMSVLVSACHNAIAFVFLWAWWENHTSHGGLAVVAAAFILSSVALSIEPLTEDVVGIVQRIQIALICVLVAASPWWWKENATKNRVGVA